MQSFSSAAHIEELINDLPQADGSARARAAARQDQLTKPPGSLGRLEQIALWMAGWQETDKPHLDAGKCLVFAGNHGVVDARNKGLLFVPHCQGQRLGELGFTITLQVRNAIWRELQKLDIENQPL